MTTAPATELPLSGTKHYAVRAKTTSFIFERINEDSRASGIVAGPRCARLATATKRSQTSLTLGLS
jgi:hypothetical protein